MAAQISSLEVYEKHTLRIALWTKNKHILYCTNTKYISNLCPERDKEKVLQDQFMYSFRESHGLEDIHTVAQCCISCIVITIRLTYVYINPHRN